MRARPLQAVQQQLGCRARGVEGGVRGGIPGQQRGGLVEGARPPQDVQQPGHAMRVVEVGVRGRVAGQQRGGLLVRALQPQVGQQEGWSSWRAAWFVARRS